MRKLAFIFALLLLAMPVHAAVGRVTMSVITATQADAEAVRSELAADLDLISIASGEFSYVFSRRR